MIVFCRQRCFSTFVSPLSVDKLYPQGSHYLTRLSSPTLKLNSNKPFSGFIPPKEIEINYCLSSGPGGQNVNKVATKVNLRFHLQSASWLSSDVKNKLSEKLKLTKEGDVLCSSDRTRSRMLNQADAFQKLRFVIWEALKDSIVPSREENEEIKRKQQIKAAQNRLKEKRSRADIKQFRKGPE